MDIWVIVYSVFVAICVWDTILFSIGKLGLFKKFVGERIGSEYHFTKKHLVEAMNLHPLKTMLFTKLGYGMAFVSIIFFGEHVEFKKFIFPAIFWNFIMFSTVGLIAVLLNISLANILQTFKGIRREILILAVSFLGMYLINISLKRKKNYILRG